MTPWPLRRPATRVLWTALWGICLVAAAVPGAMAEGGPGTQGPGIQGPRTQGPRTQGPRTQGSVAPVQTTAGVEVNAAGERTGEAEDVPITVVVVRHARPGCAVMLERLVVDTFEVRSRTPGHVSTDFLRPSEPGSNAYTIIFKFDRMSHYRQWLASPERSVWLERMARYTDGPPEYQYHSGLDAWVGLPGEPSARSPEKYKTVAVTWLAIFPLVFGVSTAIAPLTSGLPPVAATALTTAIVVPALGYGLMPVMTWVFRDWLYPPAPECQS